MSAETWGTKTGRTRDEHSVAFALPVEREVGGSIGSGVHGEALWIRSVRHAVLVRPRHCQGVQVVRAWVSIGILKRGEGQGIKPMNKGGNEERLRCDDTGTKAK